ncbi:MAG TPA: adenylate/guanylate cyclase domain-containing protein [Anaerolineae bacterium]|nr:adenylate/guanylate cyclase domain-containing protein [Anaerolineae bacterium]
MDSREQIEQSIIALEAQREVLGDVVVDASVNSLRQKLASLEPQRQEGQQQRKHVTVLFASVPNLATLAINMDAELIAQAMNTIWQRLDRIITDHNGHIDKHMGETVMALWGVQQAREDDPEQAVHAALMMQGALAEFAQEKELDLQLRVGINTGPVLLGMVGLTGEFTAMGDTVNTASRVEQAMALGAIGVTHDTYRHVRGVFDVLAQDPFQVKGKQELLQTYVVTQAKERAFRLPTRGVEGIETKMMGRQAELNHLQQMMLTVMMTGKRRAVTVVGEAGIGKSRLMYEFDNWYELRPEFIRYFKGRGRAEQQTVPYSLVRSLLQYRFEIHDSDPLQIVRQKLEKGLARDLGVNEGTVMRAHIIGQLVGYDFSDSQHVQPLLSDSRQIYQRARNYLTQYWQAIGKQETILVFIEDMHWVDASSLDLVAEIVGKLDDCPALFVFVTRPEIGQRRPDWGDGWSWHTQITLQPLTLEATRQLVIDILRKVKAVPDALRDMIVANASGNPYYVEELIKMLVEDDVIVKGVNEWQINPTRLMQVRVPPTLTGLLQARLDSLNHRERFILQIGAVAGRVFWDEMLIWLLREENESKVADGVHQSLSWLVEREFLYQRSHSAFADTVSYLFRHALLREVVYESILKRQRRRYHYLVATWLQAEAGERAAELAGMIADHWQAAGEAVAASDYLQAAGQQAYERHGYKEALPLFERALELLEKHEGRKILERRLVLVQKIGIVLSRQDDWQLGRKRLEESLEIAQELGDVKRVIVAYNHLGWLATEQGAYEIAQNWLEMGLGLAREHNEREGVATALWHLGRVRLYRVGGMEPMVYLEESLALYQALGDERAMANVLISMGTAVGLIEDWRLSDDYYRQALALARKLGDTWVEATVLNNLGDTERVMGNYDEAQAFLKQALTLVEEMGNVLYTALCIANLGHVSREKGDLEAALPYYQQASEMYINLEAWPFLMDVLVGWGYMLIEAGETEKALAIWGTAMHHEARDNEVEELAIGAIEQWQDVDIVAAERALAGELRCDLRLAAKALAANDASFLGVTRATQPG